MKFTLIAALLIASTEAVAIKQKVAEASVIQEENLMQEEETAELTSP